MSIPHPKAPLSELLHIETLEHPTNAQQLSVLLDRGTFRRLSSSDNPADRFLVYTPKTLPYNPSAPLRNTVPYIPLRFSAAGVEIDPVLPPEFVNPSVSKFVRTFNQKLSPAQKAELRAEQQLIREAEEKGYEWIDWNVSAEDAAGGDPDADQILANIRRDAEGRDLCVVLMHDTAKTDATVEALPAVIDWFRGQGYHFCTVEQMYEARDGG